MWGRSAGRCAFAECRNELFLDDSEFDPIVIFGDIAHIEASSNIGPRGSVEPQANSRDAYENLILLCKNCHARIDGQSVKYNIKLLQKIKNDHEAWVRSCLPERGLSTTSWTMVILKGDHPVDMQKAITALSPDYQESSHVINIPSNSKSWSEVHTELLTSVKEIFNNKDPFNMRFAVFPLAKISACIDLGYLLTDRSRIKLFQYHRHTHSWCWDESETTESEFQISEFQINGLPKQTSFEIGEIIICIQISAKIQNHHLENLSDAVIGEVSLSIKEPSTSWLKQSSQINQFGLKIQELFECIQTRFPNATRWHLFSAVPAPIAVRIGQAMNFTMIPPTQLYEFNRSKQPVYKPSLCLGENEDE